MTRGRWKRSRMPARYTERQAADRGAVAKYYQGRDTNSRGQLPEVKQEVWSSPMPVVKRHRSGDQMPAVIHPGFDPAAINLCRELASEVAVQCAILFGSRAQGGWDEQSDLDVIIVHEAPGRQGWRRCGKRGQPGPGTAPGAPLPGVHGPWQPPHRGRAGADGGVTGTLPRPPADLERRHGPGGPGRTSRPGRPGKDGYSPVRPARSSATGMTATLPTSGTW